MAEANKYAAQQQAEAQLYQRQKEAEARQFEAQRQAEAQKGRGRSHEICQGAGSCRYPCSRRGRSISYPGKGVLQRLRLWRKRQRHMPSTIRQPLQKMMIKVLPDIAAKVAEPLGQIDKITISRWRDGENGVGKVAGNVPVVMAKVFESMKEATGIDLSEIINADSYDAKVNRNVNVTGLDGVNLVVNADTDKNGEKTEN